MAYSKFEDLPCWQKAREMSHAVYGLLNHGPLTRDWTLKDQIWRSAGLVMDSIAEGYDRGTLSEMDTQLGRAQGGCGQLQSQLYRAMDCDYVAGDQFEAIYDLVDECRNRIRALRRSLRKKGGGKT
jgi:four helix bundle protein